MADLIILAVDTPQAAVGEEDRSRAFLSHKRRFFSEMGKGTRDLDLGNRAAFSCLALFSINTAVSGTETAILIDRV